MLIPIRQAVQLSGGSVTLRAWPAAVADSQLLDLLTFTATLGQLQEEWHDYSREDIDAQVWGAFWRLVNASLTPGCQLPKRLTWPDRLSLVEAMWALNDVEEAQSKMTALSGKVSSLLRRMRARQTQGQMMTA